MRRRTTTSHLTVTYSPVDRQTYEDAAMRRYAERKYRDWAEDDHPDYRVVSLSWLQDDLYGNATVCRIELRKK